MQCNRCEFLNNDRITGSISQEAQLKARGEEAAFCGSQTCRHAFALRFPVAGPARFKVMLCQVRVSEKNRCGCRQRFL